MRFLILHKHYLSKQDTMLFITSRPQKYVRLFFLVFRVVFSGAASRFVGFVIFKGLLTTCIMSLRSRRILFFFHFKVFCMGMVCLHPGLAPIDVVVPFFATRCVSYSARGMVESYQ